MKLKYSALLFFLLAITIFQAPAHARVKVQDSVTINAKMDSVWQALLDYQKEEKEFNKKLVSNKNDTVTGCLWLVQLPLTMLKKITRYRKELTIN